MSQMSLENVWRGDGLIRCECGSSAASMVEDFAPDASNVWTRRVTCFTCGRVAEIRKQLQSGPARHQEEGA